MKILICVNSGMVIYKFKKELLQDFIKSGAEVFITLPDDEYDRELTQIGCRLIKVCMNRRGINFAQDLKLYRDYKKIIRQIGPDVVVTYTVKPNIYAGRAAAKAKIPYYVNITGLGTSFQKNNLLKKLVVFLYKNALKKVRFVFFENQANLNVFTDEKIISKDKAVLLPGAGVNLGEFAVKPMPEGKTKFLFIGRIMKEKGVEELFKAAFNLKQKYPEIEFGFLGKYEEDYSDRVNQLEEQDIIKYYGFENDVKPFIEQAQCVILPSYHEGMSNTLLEAASMGRPLITSDIPGCREAVQDGINGFLVPPQDAVSLETRIEEFIQLDMSEKIRMGAASRALMEQNFNRNEVNKMVLDRMDMK